MQHHTSVDKNATLILYGLNYSGITDYNFKTLYTAYSPEKVD